MAAAHQCPSSSIRPPTLTGTSIPLARRASTLNPLYFHSPLRWRPLAISRRPLGIRISAGDKASSDFNFLLAGPELTSDSTDYGVVSIQHIGILCQSLEKSLYFYQRLLGLKVNEARPHDKLPFRGVWLWVGSEMIHLMELPNPDPSTGRPEHGDYDRHICIAVRDISQLKIIFDKTGIKYALSHSGRPAIFTRDPDGNTLAFMQTE